MLRRNRPEPVAPPDPALMTLVETTGAAARVAEDLRTAIAIVLREVSDTSNWAAGHAWVPGGDGTWVSAGLWHPEDGIALGALRRACVEAPPRPARGHLALALHMAGTQWVSDLSGWTGTAMYDAAIAAGVTAAVACPVYAHGRPVAILEWYLTSAERPSPDVAHVLGHLSAVLSEVAERPAVIPAPRQGTMSNVRETLRWVTEEGVVARLLTC